MRKFLILLLLVSFTLRAESTAEIEKPPKVPSQLEGNVAEESERLELAGLFSVLVPSRLTLSNKEYEVLYSSRYLGISSLQVALSAPLGNWEGFRFSGQARLGYGYHEGLFPIEPLGRVAANTQVQLHWVPFSLATRAEYRFVTLPFVRPTLTLGTGVQWLHQVGKTDATSGDFLIPFYYITPGLTFLDSNDPSDWFGGFNFGVSYVDSINSDQTFKAWSYELSATILL